MRYRNGVIVMTGDRAEMLGRLDVFVGEWVLDARFPEGRPSPPRPGGDGPTARSRFEWALDGQVLVQRTEIPAPAAPDGLMIVRADPATGSYTQHYFDSRGVARLYAMTFDGRVWTLTRESPDFTPLEFRQRFTGTFSEDATAITGGWEVRFDGGEWEHDFALDYRRVG
ncbi:hypothetical protein ACFWBV_00215 [Streptomyces sp. NPDC060030]|uniref:hypothetical protein n=1 Tax=Streptomyces sp. NPDC060030 TaxID=3347042 RepID=UPI0036C52A63